MTADPILITGGAGYIGTHAVLGFQAAGYPVVVIDDLSTGRRELVPTCTAFYEGNVADDALVRSIIRKHGVTAVIHFAGSLIVPESVGDPLEYYLNNTSVSRSLIKTCVEMGVRRFIYSSTAAVYGMPGKIPVSEDAPTVPINPYGTSKLITEWILRDVASAHGFNYAALRYFNVAGADPRGRAGQATPEATHLIKVACQAAVGARGYIEIFGEDYDTPDGTCIRDYVHVTDLVDAHIKAFEYLQAEGENLVLNCGYGNGYSVREVLSAVEDETGCRLDVRSAARRPGDPPQLVSDNGKIRKTLGWQPNYDDLGAIVRTALNWEKLLTERTQGGSSIEPAAD